MQPSLLPTSALWALLSAGGGQSLEQQEIRVFTERGHVEEADLELEKRAWPRGPDPDLSEAEASCKGFAREAGLESPRFRAADEVRSVPYTDGRPSPVRERVLEIAGRGAYEKLDRFLGLLASWPRPIDIQQLSITAAASDTVRFEARLAFASLGTETPPSQPPRDEMLEEFVARRRRAEDEYRAAVEGGDAWARRALSERRVLLDRLIELRRAGVERLQLMGLLVGLRKQGESSRRVAGALAGFTTWAAEDAVALTEVRFDGETVLEGVTLGTSAHDSLMTTLGAGGFDVAALRSVPRGRCQAFVARVGTPLPARSDKPVHGNGLFDDATDAVCSVPPRKAAAHVEVRGEGGPVTARLRDVDVADLVGLVFEATGYGFVVDPDATLVVDADVTSATPEQVINALARAGLSVGPGPLRRVSFAAKAGKSPAAPATYSGKALSVSFKNAPVGDFLCLLKDYAGTAILSSPGLDGEMTLYAKDVPWDQILAAGAASLGFTFVGADGDRRAFLGPEAAARVPGHPGAVEPCASVADPPTRRWSAAPPTTGILNTRDLQLAGFAKVKAKWSGYAYGPFSDVLLPLAPGYALLDGDIVAAGPTSVSVETRGGKRVELTLP